MWAGFTLTTTLMFLGFLAIDTIIIIDTKFPGHHQIISQILLLLAVGIALLIFLFVILLILMFVYNGIKILFKEGTKWSNFLSLGMGVAILFLVFPCLVALIHSHGFVSLIYFCHSASSI